MSIVQSEVSICKSSSLGQVNHLDRLIGTILKEVTSDQVWVLRNIKNKQHGKSNKSFIYVIGLTHGKWILMLRNMQQYKMTGKTPISNVNNTGFFKFLYLVS